jgi:AbrB family looped-hinge helix DNA binding protein
MLQQAGPPFRAGVSHIGRFRQNGPAVVVPNLDLQALGYNTFLGSNVAPEDKPRDGDRSRACLKYESLVMLKSMKVGERGQVTIPKEIRERFGLGPETEVEFRVVQGSIVLKKAPKKLDLRKWKGRCKDSFAELGYSSVDKFVDDVRAR